MDRGQTNKRVDHDESWRRRWRYQEAAPPGPLPATAVEDRAGWAASG
ncbi:MAG TPA: hypothetical protein VG452_01520 [Egibacteraceae bacterium]|nr:hypothetical protein [Egibacteraceae bacterium]